MDDHGRHEAPTHPDSHAPAPWGAAQQYDAFAPQQPHAGAHQPFGHAQPQQHMSAHAQHLPAAPQLAHPQAQQQHQQPLGFNQAPAQHHPYAQHRAAAPQHQQFAQVDPYAQQHAGAAVHPPAQGHQGGMHAAPAGYQYGSAALAPNAHQHPGVDPRQLEQLQQFGLQPAQHGGGFPQPGAPAGYPGGTVAVAAAPAKRPGGAPRMRWETIVPVAAAALLLLSGVLVVKNFDRITGSEEPLPKASATAPAADGAGADLDSPAGEAAADLPPVQDGNLPAEEPSVALAKVRKLTKLGRYDEAKTILKPVLNAGEPTAEMLKVRDQLTSASRQNAKLMALLGKQRQAASWYGMLTTLKQLEQLRPLSKDLVKVRAEAKAHVGLKNVKAANVKPAAKPPAPPSGGGSGAGATGSRTPPAATTGGGARPTPPSVANPSTPPATVAPTVAAGTSAASGDGCASHTHNAGRHGCA